MRKRANGEGTIYETIQKNKRKDFLKDICNTCKNCKHKCNRELFEKCNKCKSCKDCLKYCDRWRCYKVTKAQITIGNERKSAGTGKNSREVKEKVDTNTKKLQERQLIKNGELTLSEVMRINEKNKLEKTLIKENSYNRNLCTIELIEGFPIANKKMYDLVQNDLEELLSTLVKLNTSQSNLDKVYDEIHQACKLCKIDIFDEITRVTFCSKVDVKEVQAFTIQEEKQLINYLNEHEYTLVNPRKSNINSMTMKNIIKFALATSMRVGEICSLDKNLHIDMDNQRFKIERTVTRDLDNKSVIGTTTKTGRKRKQRSGKDIRYVPFDILFDSEEVVDIIKEQKEISTSNLLFTDKDGQLISHSSLNSIFKRICKDAGITKDCNFHMTKHTGVTRMLENGMDIYAISEVVGTSVKILTETYAHILSEFVQREIEKSKVVRKDNNLSLDNTTKNTGKIIQFKALS